MGNKHNLKYMYKPNWIHFFLNYFQFQVLEFFSTERLLKKAIDIQFHTPLKMTIILEALKMFHMDLTRAPTWFQRVKIFEIFF